MIGWLLLLAAAPGPDDCGDKPNQTAMTMCQKAEADRADAAMNTAWKQVYPAMQRLDRKGQPGYAATLLASQRAWLAFRDSECRIESYEWRGGTMQPFTENQCRAEVTRTRTQQLRAMLAWTTR